MNIKTYPWNKILFPLKLFFVNAFILNFSILFAFLVNGLFSGGDINTHSIGFVFGIVMIEVWYYFFSYFVFVNFIFFIFYSIVREKNSLFFHILNIILLISVNFLSYIDLFSQNLNDNSKYIISNTYCGIILGTILSIFYCYKLFKNPSAKIIFILRHSLKNIFIVNSSILIMCIIINIIFNINEEIIIGPIIHFGALVFIYCFFNFFLMNLIFFSIYYLILSKKYKYYLNIIGLFLLNFLSYIMVFLTLDISSYEGYVVYSTFVGVFLGTAIGINSLKKTLLVNKTV